MKKFIYFLISIQVILVFIFHSYILLNKNNFTYNYRYYSSSEDIFFT